MHTVPEIILQSLYHQVEETEYPLPLWMQDAADPEGPSNHQKPSQQASIKVLLLQLRMLRIYYT